MDTIKVFGIPNCDSTRKLLNWLKKHVIDFLFHDYKKEGIGASVLNDWCNQAGWESILNKKSSTWRGLSDADQASVKNQESAIKIMLGNNSIIKRPITTIGDKLIIGFKEEYFSKQIKHKK